LPRLAVMCRRIAGKFIHRIVVDSTLGSDSSSIHDVSMEMDSEAIDCVILPS